MGLVIPGANGNQSTSPTPGLDLAAKGVAPSTGGQEIWGEINWGTKPYGTSLFVTDAHIRIPKTGLWGIHFSWYWADMSGDHRGYIFKRDANRQNRVALGHASNHSQQCTVYEMLQEGEHVSAGADGAHFTLKTWMAPIHTWIEVFFIR